MFNLIIWRAVDKHDGGVEPVLLKDAAGTVYVGWWDGQGWTDLEQADHFADHIDPPPTKFARIPKG